MASICDKLIIRRELNILDKWLCLLACIIFILIFAVYFIRLSHVLVK